MFYLFAGWIATSVGRDHKKLLPNSWQIFDSKKASSFAESIFKMAFWKGTGHLAPPAI